MTEQPKPDWWPECPYSTEEWWNGDDKLRYEGWKAAEKEILERLKERGIEL